MPARRRGRARKPEVEGLERHRLLSLAAPPPIDEFPVTAGSSPAGIATGPDGAIWFTESNGNEIGRITAGSHTESHQRSHESNGESPSRFEEEGTHMRRSILGLLTLALIGATTPAGAGTILALHQGANNPTTESFTYSDEFGPATVGPISNDLGNPAWSIAADSVNTQVFYFDGFTSSQNTVVATQGFTMTALARVPQGPENATGSSFYPSAVVAVDFGTARRFDLDIGLNSNGDTVAVLATQLLGGSNFSTPGPSYTLTGSGSTYHEYQLIYDPTTQAAALYIDGVDRIDGYTGETQFYDSGGASFGAVDGGQGIFSHVEVDLGTVPEPSTLTMSTIAMLLLLGFVRSRRRAMNGKGVRHVRHLPRVFKAH
jgi:hypothetical protein